MQELDISTAWMIYVDRLYGAEPAQVDDYNNREHAYLTGATAILGVVATDIAREINMRGTLTGDDMLGIFNKALADVSAKLNENMKRKAN